MNDAGPYGHGQLATILRAVTCNPAIESLNKVEGITFRVREIVTAAEKLMASSPR
ncbi:MAG: hypothetical protein HKO57_12270 [Akkermansiaceae bacterium]|nr:hypothetical protein [Akkermansiaceae bacterium]